MKEKPHRVHCFHQKLCSVWFSWILVNGGLKSLTLLSSDWWSKWHEDDSINKIYEHHEHTMDHGIMRNANGMLMCSSSSVSEMYLQHSKWKEQMYLILWGYGYLNWGHLSILNDKGNGHYVCQEIVEDGRCLVEREKERSHKPVNFYSSESCIELH